MVRNLSELNTIILNEKDVDWTQLTHHLAPRVQAVNVESVSPPVIFAVQMVHDPGFEHGIVVERPHGHFNQAEYK